MSLIKVLKHVFTFIMVVALFGGTIPSFSENINPSGDMFYEPIVYKDGQRQILTFRDVNNDNH